MKTPFFIIFFLLGHLLYSQCYEDRHNTSLSSTWRSCTISQSPNPIRGDSHWISYDLGEVRKLQQTQFWNINNPDYLDDSARQIAIDYSLDGVNWNFWGIWEAPMADGSGFYEGVEGPNFDGLDARFILMTILNNQGGECFGFAEIKIGVEKPLATADELSTQQLVAYPNPAESFTMLKLSTSYAGPATIALLDLAGRILKEESIQLIGAEQEIRYELDVDASGQYIIRLITTQSELSTELSVIKNQ